MSHKKESINFLYIADEAPPIISPCSVRLMEISKRLIKDNIKPIILTRKVGTKSFIDYSSLKEIPPDVKIYRTPFISLSPKLFLYNYFHWIPHAFIRGKQLLKKRNDIKFIFATQPSYYSLIVGYLLKLKYKIPLIIEYNDPWSFNPYDTGFKLSPNKVFNYFLEKRILKSADIIIVLSPPLKDFLFQHFPIIKKKPIFTLERGVEILKKSSQSSSKDNKIIITFTGSLYGRRSVLPLLRIISELKEEGFFQDSSFIFNIFGKYEKLELINAIKKLGITDLIFLGGLISRKQVYKEISRSKLAVHIGEDLKYPTLSFKVGDYLSCRKKILYLGREDSYTSHYLKINDFGYVIPLNYLKKGKEKFKSIITGIREGRINTEIDIDKISNLSWELIVEKFKKIIKKLNLK